MRDFMTPALRSLRGALLAALVGLAALGACGIGCSDISGGAVELSWVVRADGRAVSRCSCADPAIAQVRIELRGVSPDAVAGTTPCAGRSACTFRCDRQTGATPLDIPAGQYAVTVTPLGPDGADLTQPAADRGTVEVPPPILRDVIWGQATQLGAMQLSAACSRRCMANSRSVCTAE